MTRKQAQKLGQAALNGFMKFFRSKGVNPNTTELAAANKPAVYGTVGKAIAGIELVKLADRLIYNIPVLGDLLARIYGKVSDLEDMTFGKTPVLKEVTKVRHQLDHYGAPNLSKYVNDPKYYEHTDMHQAFQIPFNFPDSELVDFATGINTAAIAVLHIGVNPNADTFARQARQTQVMDLLKGVRGLSGRQPYTVGDLDMYNRHCEFIVNEYFRLKFALRASQLYIMTKARMPRNLLKGLGWDADDFIKNRASYVDALTTLGNFITNNMPMYGVQLERIRGLWDKLIPDSNDGKVALLYKVDIHHTAFIPSANAADQYGDFFMKEETLNYPITRYQLHMPVAAIVYNTYMNQMLEYMRQFLACECFTALRADIIGAFGKSAIWTDSKINEVADYKYQDLLHSFDELFLTQLQNATILYKKSLNVITVDDNVLDAWTATHDTFINEKINQTNDSFDLPSSSDSSDTNHVLVEIQSTNENAEQTIGALYSSATDGFAGGALSPDGQFDYRLYTDSTAVLANKYNMTESEQIEILQLLAFAVKGKASLSEGEVVEQQYYVTNTMFLDNITMIYTSNGTDQYHDMCSFVEHASDTIAAFNDSRINDLTLQFWSQADYMPKICSSRIHPKLKKVNSSIHWDFNIMGSISRKAFYQAVRLAAYSLSSPDVKITEIKKINNIVDVYSIK